MLCSTLVHGTNKNEIRQRNQQRRKAEKSECESEVGTK